MSYDHYDEFEKISFFSGSKSPDPTPEWIYSNSGDI